MPIILNTQTKTYSHEGLNIKTLQLYTADQRVSFSKQLLDTLKAIETPYVLLLGDDFFLETPVDDEKVRQCIEWMDENKNIATFNFMPSAEGYGESKAYPGFELQKKKVPYRINGQASIWRVDYLIKILRKHENPWQFEVRGSIRSRRYKEEIYTLCRGNKPIFNYAWGNVVKSGKWNQELIDKLSNQYGIHVDTAEKLESKYFTKQSLINRSISFVKSFI